MNDVWICCLGLIKPEEESRREESRYVTRNPSMPVMNRIIICLSCSVRGACYTGCATPISKKTHFSSSGCLATLPRRCYTCRATSPFCWNFFWEAKKIFCTRNIIFCVEEIFFLFHIQTMLHTEKIPSIDMILMPLFWKLICLCLMISVGNNQRLEVLPMNIRRLPQEFESFFVPLVKVTPIKEGVLIFGM